MTHARRLKVLYICHNHPAIRPGGAEQYALELYEAMRESADVEPMLLARTGPPVVTSGPPHPGTPFSRLNDDPHQLLIYTDGAWNDVLGVFPDKLHLTLHYRELLETWRPDVVHVQHTAMIGYDLLRVTRAALPDAAIIYTLHDFRPLCHHHGLLVKTQGNTLCWGSSPAACHACYPAIAPETFFLRDRFIRSHLALVDRFLAPSEFLRQRFVDWGIDAERIAVLDYGRQRPATPLPAAPGPKRRFGFFGQINPFKGVDVLLRAMSALASPSARRVLDASLVPHLWMNGANLDLQGAAFRAELETLRRTSQRLVTWLGPYTADQVGDRLAMVDWVVVPSIWWENSPLVIQEAFAHGRPVICSDVGGMAEKVTDGVNGLHFRVGDADDLAHTLRRAASEPGLWERLQAGIPPVPSIAGTVAYLVDLYGDVLAHHRASHVP